MRGSRILLLGLAYKRDTGDARESPAVRVAELLMSLGADVRAVDPHVATAPLAPDVRRVELTLDEVENANLVVLLVNHSTFDLSVLRSHLDKVFDTRNEAGLEGAERL